MAQVLPECLSGRSCLSDTSWTRTSVVKREGHIVWPGRAPPRPREPTEITDRVIPCHHAIHALAGAARFLITREGICASSLAAARAAVVPRVAVHHFGGIVGGWSDERH